MGARVDASAVGHSERSGGARRHRPRPPRCRLDEGRRRGGERGPRGRRQRPGTKRVVEIGAPVVYYSTDYVFDGTKRTPYLESDIPDPQSAYGRTKLAGEREIGDRGWIVRSSWLFGWTGHNFVRTMLKLGAERDEVSVVADQVGCPTYVGHLAEATRAIVELDPGLYHVAAEGECSWAEFASAIFEEAGLDCRVVPITTAELGRPAAEACVLRAAQREARDAEAAALARRLTSLPRPVVVRRRARGCAPGRAPSPSGDSSRREGAASV